MHAVSSKGFNGLLNAKFIVAASFSLLFALLPIRAVADQSEAVKAIVQQNISALLEKYETQVLK